jgi:hypothetical protein
MTRVFKPWGSGKWIAMHPIYGQTGYSIQLNSNKYECFNMDGELLATENSLPKAKKYLLDNTSLGLIRNPE